MLYLAANPGMVVIGEGPAEDLDDYSGYNKLRQSSAGDIVLECAAGVAHVYIANQYYSVDFLQQECMPNTTYGKYIGTLPCGED
ncbi:MAG: hypothetical protein H0W21_07710 [Actinobacteria bacterium]|nr:hypothetical protein [Actinomycetota bacterium]